MRAILTAVGYHRELSLTLPYNRHHFESVTVVTSPADLPNVAPIADACGASVLATDLFFVPGAHFAKWLALEWGLDQIGRRGWLCIMDADVAWPKVAPLDLRPGTLTTPLRRMCPDVPDAVPPEAEWRRWPLHRVQTEWSGFSQVFHADDPVLGPPPWHDTSWKTAAGADSFFQAKWPPRLKVRPSWECVHFGEAGTNWAGRTPEGRAALREMMRARRRPRRPGEDPFARERLPGPG